MSYKVKLNIFEGPFDLLVYLIENAEMSIYDIRVSEITSQYLEHIELMKQQDVTVGAEFMVLAATLIELKSKMLLPRIKVDGGIEEDPRAELAQKLAEYTAFKKCAANLEELMDTAAFKLTKPAEDLVPFTGEPDEYLRMDMPQFINAFKAFIYKRKKTEELRGIRDRITREKITVAAKTSVIKRLLEKAKNGIVKFRELLASSEDGSENRYDKIITFISLLEMAKTHKVRLRQKSNFKEIEIELHKDAAES